MYHVSKLSIQCVSVYKKYLYIMVKGRGIPVKRRKRRRRRRRRKKRRDRVT